MHGEPSGRCRSRALRGHKTQKASSCLEAPVAVARPQKSKGLEGYSRPFGKLTRQRPTLPHSCPCSTIGSEKLDFRVRDGIGYGLLDIATGNVGHPKFSGLEGHAALGSSGHAAFIECSMTRVVPRGVPAAISTLVVTRGQPPPGLRTSTNNVCLRELGQAARPISTGELRALQRFHIRPINLVVFKGPLETSRV